MCVAHSVFAVCYVLAHYCACHSVVCVLVLVGWLCVRCRSCVRCRVCECRSVCYCWPLMLLVCDTVCVLCVVLLLL